MNCPVLCSALHQTYPGIYEVLYIHTNRNYRSVHLSYVLRLACRRVGVSVWTPSGRCLNRERKGFVRWDGR